MHIAPISPCESSRLHLLAVTADGRRVYFSTSPGDPGYSGVPASPKQAPRPTELRPQVVRQAPPLPSARSGGAGQSRCLFPQHKNPNLTPATMMPVLR